MNVLDGIILAPLAYFAFQGFRNGFLREVLGLGGVILALFLGFRYMGDLGDWISHIAGVTEIWMTVLAFVLIFGGVIIGMQLIIYSLEAVLKMAFLSMPNRIFGLLFGLLKSSLFVSVLFILLLGLGQPGEETRNESMLYPYIISVAPGAYNIIGTVYPGSEAFSETIRRAIEDFDF